MDGKQQVLEFLDFLLDLYPNLSRDDVLSFMDALKTEEGETPSLGSAPIKA